MNKLFKTLIKTAVYYLDHAEDATEVVRGRVRNGVDDLARRAAWMVHGEEDHTVRYALSFAAGIGVGIGAGLLLAPASGEQTREALSDKLHNLGDTARERFSRETKQTGT